MGSLTQQSRVSNKHMADDPKQFDFTKAINRLQEINTWFQNEDINLDEGLQKLKEGKDGLKKPGPGCKRLKTSLLKSSRSLLMKDRKKLMQKWIFLRTMLLHAKRSMVKT